MKIVHVISSMSTAYGGPARTTLLTARGLNRLGIDTQILTKQKLAGEELVSTEPFIHYLPVPSFYYERWGYASSYGKALSQIDDADIYHIQGLWQYPGYVTARYATKKNRPYVVTLHGSMYPDAMSYSSFFKKLALFSFERRLLQRAACIHVTCSEEMTHYRDLGFTNPIALISNPLETCRVQNSFYTDNKKRVGYLGRLHPRKRVERLLEVWRYLDEPGELLIMGDGEPDYISYLKKEMARLHVSNVRFMGWVSGVEKDRLLASLTCLVVPSDFENFGMIVPEALLQETPVIASIGSPWEDLETYRCGRWVDNNTNTLTEAVGEMLNLDADTLKEMGKRGRQLVLHKYALEVVSQEMAQMYEWILGNADKPNFIFD